MPEEETETTEPQEREEASQEEEKPKKKRKLFGFLKREKKEEPAPKEGEPEEEKPEEKEEPKKEGKKLVWGEGKVFRKKEEVSPEEKDVAGEEYDLLKKIDKMLAGETPEEAGVEEAKPAEEPKKEGEEKEPKPEVEAKAPEEAPKEGKPAPAEKKEEEKPAEAPKEGKKPEDKKEEPKPDEKKEEGGKPKKKKEVTYEENVISAEEFTKMEAKESKGGLLGRLRGKKEEGAIPEAEPARPGAPTTTDLMLRIEKGEGRFEAVNTSIANVGERISHLSEEIGELRSSIMERERSFRNIQTEFAKVKDVIENIEPAKFTKSLESMKVESIKSEAKLEGLDTRLISLKKKMDDLKEVMDKVHGIKNLMAVAEAVRKILDKMEEKKAYITKTASKSESMFVEVTNKLREFEEYRRKIDSNAEMLYELMRSVDATEAKMEKVSTKEAMEKVEERAEFLKTEYEDRVNELKDIISELVNAIRTGDILLKSGKKVFAPRSEMDRLKDRFDDLRKAGRVGVSTDELDKVHAELIEHIAESMRKSRTLQKRMGDFESDLHKDLVDSRLSLTKALKRANVEFGHEPEEKPRKKAKKAARKVKKKPQGTDRRVLEDAREKLKEEVEKGRIKEIMGKEKAEIKEERRRLEKEARKMKAAMIKAHKMHAPKKKAHKAKRKPAKKLIKKKTPKKKAMKRKRKKKK